MKLKKLLLVSVLITLNVFIVCSNTYAAGNCAFSAGGSFSDLNIESAVLTAKNKYASMGYRSYYTTEATTDIINGYFQNGTRRLESDIIFFAGHGNYSKIMQAPNVGLSSNSDAFLRTHNFDWSKTKLVTIMGCSTGKETSASFINIAYDIWVRSGYKNATMGWRDTIYDKDIVSWANRYNSKLAEGATLRTAIDYANSYNNYYNNNIKDLAFYGAWQSTFKQSTTSVASEQAITNNTNHINYTVKFENESDLNNIVQLLNNNYNYFNVNDYEISIFRLDSTYKNYTIDLQYKIGDCYTDQGYVVAVENGKVTQITNNMKDTTTHSLSISTINKTLTEDKIQDLKVLAVEELKNQLSKENEEKLSIISQDYKKILDEKTNSIKTVIFTVYSLDNETQMGVVNEY